MESPKGLAMEDSTVIKIYIYIYIYTLVPINQFNKFVSCI